VGMGTVRVGVEWRSRQWDRPT